MYECTHVQDRTDDEGEVTHREVTLTRVADKQGPPEPGARGEIKIEVDPSVTLFKVGLFYDAEITKADPPKWLSDAQKARVAEANAKPKAVK